MARMVRMALDAALISLRVVSPAVSKMWGVTKSAISSTPAKPLVLNNVVKSVEDKLAMINYKMYCKISAARDKQYVAELKYLQSEIIKTRKKMKEAIGTAVRPIVGTAWQYFKVESVPPLTVGFFNGPVGRTLEAIVGGVTDGVLSGLRGAIKVIDAAALRRKQAAEDAAKAIIEERNRKAKERAEALEKKAVEAKEAVVKAAKAKEAPKEKEADPAALQKDTAAKAAKSETKPEAKNAEGKPEVIKKDDKKDAAAKSAKSDIKPEAKNEPKDESKPTKPKK